MSLAAFLAFAGLSLMAAISPGPAVLMAARTGLTEGFRTGAFLAAGIGAGAVFWAAAAMFGMGILFAWAPALLWAMKIAGGLWLIWLGIGLWRRAAEPLAADPGGAAPRGAVAAFRLGLFTQLANPKPVVVFGAIFLGTIPPGTALWQMLAVLAVVFLNETLWNIAVARIFSLDRTRARYISLKTIIDRVFAGGLALLGAKLAAS